MAAAQQGDELAFAWLYRAVQPRLLRYLYGLAPDVAEDLAAEAWVQVIRGLHRFSGDAVGFRAWVFTVGHHRWSDHRRRLSRHPRAVADDAALGETASADRVEDSVEEIMSTESALRLIGRLPPDQAEVVLLRVVAGLDVTRTARIVGKTPGAVRVLAHRGLRRLAGLLGENAAARPGTPSVGRGV